MRRGSRRPKRNCGSPMREDERRQKEAERGRRARQERPSHRGRQDMQSAGRSIASSVGRQWHPVLRGIFGGCSVCRIRTTSRAGARVRDALFSKDEAALLNSSTPVQAVGFGRPARLRSRWRTGSARCTDGHRQPRCSSDRLGPARPDDRRHGRCAMEVTVHGPHMTSAFCYRVWVKGDGWQVVRRHSSPVPAGVHIE